MRSGAGGIPLVSRAWWGCRRGFHHETTRGFFDEHAPPDFFRRDRRRPWRTDHSVAERGGTRLHRPPTGPVRDPTHVLPSARASADCRWRDHRLLSLRCGVLAVSKICFRLELRLRWALVRSPTSGGKPVKKFWIIYA